MTVIEFGRKYNKLLIAFGGVLFWVTMCNWMIGTDVSSPDKPPTASEQQAMAKAAEAKLPGKKVTAAMFGKTWPLSVKEGRVECRDGVAVFTPKSGKVYAIRPRYWVNSPYVPLRDILSERFNEDQANDGPMSIGVLAEAAEHLCK